MRGFEGWDKEHEFDVKVEKRAVKGDEEEARALKHGEHQAGGYGCWSLYMHRLLQEADVLMTQHAAVICCSKEERACAVENVQRTKWKLEWDLWRDKNSRCCGMLLGGQWLWCLHV